MHTQRQLSDFVADGEYLEGQDYDISYRGQPAITYTYQGFQANRYIFSRTLPNRIRDTYRFSSCALDVLITLHR